VWRCPLRGEAPGRVAIVEDCCPSQELRALVYPSGMNVSNCSLRFVSDAPRDHRRATRTRWRVLSSGWQAVMVLAHLRKGRSY
jgi:hypothetical protein